MIILDKDFPFVYNTLTKHINGRLAQLVAHPLDVREVTGSSPVTTTKSSRFRTVLRSEEAITSFALNLWLDIDENNRQFIMSRLFLFLFSCSFVFLLIILLSVLPILPSVGPL